MKNDPLGKAEIIMMWYVEHDEFKICLQCNNSL